MNTVKPSCLSVSVSGGLYGTRAVNDVGTHHHLLLHGGCQPEVSSVLCNKCDKAALMDRGSVSKGSYLGVCFRNITLLRDGCCSGAIITELKMF